MIDNKDTFQPDWVSPPGDSIADLLEERGWNQVELANRTGYTTKHINQLIKGKVPLSGETALKLETVFGAPARFWMTREAQYREAVERQKLIKSYESEAGKKWFKSIPYRFMVKEGWVEDKKSIGEKISELLKYFQVASPADWTKIYQNPQVAWRRLSTKKDNTGAVAAWVRQGELRANEIDCKPYSKTRFKKALAKLATMTADEPESYGEKIVELCADAGVAVVFVQKVKGAGVSGLTKWLSKDKALIQLSLFGKSEDRFWFTFFHEAGHILLHGKKLVFLESERHNSPEEQAADKFAADILISLKDYKRLLQNPKMSKQVILNFAKEQNISPGIVVGRLQHEKRLKYNTPLNSLKRYLEISPSKNHAAGANQ